LIKLGAVDPINANLTKLGQEMSILPTEPVYSKLLINTLKPEFK
jgi:HrpA-like RNA helicase